MHTKSLLAVALVAASALAGAEPQRPRIYFPRNVKRQFLNATITSQDPSTAPSTPPVVPASSTSKRQNLGDIIPSLSDGLVPSSQQKGPTSGSSDVTTIVISSTIVVPSSPEPSASAAPSGIPGSSTGGLPETVVRPTSSPSSSPSPSPSNPPVDSSPETQVTPTISSSSSGILLAPTGIVTPTSSSDPLGGISSVLSSALSEVSTALVPNVTEPNTVPPVSSTETPVTLPTDPASVTTSVVPGPSTTEPPVTPSSTEPPVTSSSTEPPVTPSSTGPPVTLSSTEPPVSPSSTETPIPPPSSFEPTPSANTSETTTLPTISPSVTIDPTTEPPVTTTPTSTSVPGTGAVTSTPSTDLPGSTVTPVTNTSITVPPPVSSPTTILPTDSAPVTTPNITESVPTKSPTNVPSDSTSLPIITPTPTPTSSVSVPWLPSTLVNNGPPPSASPDASSATTPLVIPSDLPKAITPDSDDKPIPDNTVEIQIGFNYALNYEFVASDSRAAAQIFKLLPNALSYLLGPDRRDMVQMRRLQPLNTQKDLGYLTTIAIAAYPRDLVNRLRLDVKIPSSKLYQNPDPLTYNLTMEINSNIDILVGTLDQPGGSPGGGSPGSPGGAPNDVFNNENTNNNPSASQRATFAGITIGAMSLAAAYGAAMFVIARRYKRKRQSHQRSSSLGGSRTPSPDMRETGSPALMGGALLSRDFTSSYGGVAGGVPGGRDSHGSGRSGAGNSGRTAYISAPVAQENSLGWN